MKKVLMISAIAASVISANAMAVNVYKDDSSNLDVYGYASAAHTFNQQDKKNGSDASEFQLGVKGKHQLNDQFALIGQYEGRVYTAQYNQKHRLKNRQAWLGIDADQYGAITVGRQTGVIYDVSGLSDMGIILTGYSTAADAGLMGRADGVIQYANTIGWAKLIAQYKVSQTSDSFETGAAVNEGEAYGTGVVFEDIEGTGIGGGLAWSKTEATDTTKESEFYTGAINYVKSGVFLAATTLVGKDVNGVHSLYDNEGYAAYSFENGIMPELAYVDTNAPGYHAKYVETGVSYNFNKNFVTGVGLGWDVTGQDNNLVKTFFKFQF